MLFDGVAIGHARDVIADHPGAASLVATLGPGIPFGRQHVRLAHEQYEHLGQHPPGLTTRAVDLPVPVHPLHEKSAQCRKIFHHRPRKSHEGVVKHSNVLGGADIVGQSAPPRFGQNIVGHGAYHPADGFEP